ncbi:hypothetical protein I7I49_09030 [Sinorhizobium meliloti]|uniref:hypothetical protein n=1 Tax=Rhizobium meliloti TaxID=382 RepID=UPI00237F8351|nr:hypothetical protein [Sinorhizobium meliloti]MDE3810423.1 hypothetical protein [Sinorhizobium meliloti]
MASQKELIAVVADNMGVPKETVTVVDRYLAEAGLRTRALRGRGNTPMTYHDAAHLIIATAWDANPKDAVQLVKAYRDLPASRVKETAFVAFDALGSTFGAALANILESVPEDREAFSAVEGAPGHMSVRVIMYGPEPRAEIILMKDGQPHTFEFGPMFSRPIDLRRTAEFSQLTLGFVGESIADGLDK